MTTSVPDSLLQAIRTSRPDLPRVVSARPVAGGDISRAAVVSTEHGGSFFLKWHPHAPPGLFEAEADGLEALRHAVRDAAPSGLVVPGVVAAGRDDACQWLLMDHLRGAPDRSPGGPWAIDLGRGLATMHRSTAAAGKVEGVGGFGWSRDNYIGRLAQANAPATDWGVFWRDRRIAPQVRAAADADLLGSPELEVLDRLLDRTRDALVGCERDGPSLLHGDLWGGNVMRAEGGRAAIYDPSVYRGHREVDLAMSELFGFPDGFLPAYSEVWPVEAEYDAWRRDLYQLYYLLVHANLFGPGWVRPAVAAASRVLAELG